MKRQIVGVLMAMSLSGCIGCNGAAGTGEKIGTVVKLSKQGIVCKTWEGQLIRGGMNGGGGSFGVQPFDFTIENDDLARQVQQYMQNQTEVTIHYRADFTYHLCDSDSGGFFLVDIEPARPEEGQR